MKSKLFTNYPPPTKDLSDDLDIIASLDLSKKEVLEILTKSLIEYALASDSKSETKALDSLREIIKFRPKELEALIRFSRIFWRVEPEDTIDNIMSDLETLAVIESEKLSRLRPFLDRLVEEFKDSYSSDYLARITQHASVNNITGIDHTVDLRAIVSNSFELSDSIEEYNPNIPKLVPTAIICLRFRGNDKVVFQLDGLTLRVLQDELKAIEKEIGVAISLVGKDKVHLGRS